MFTTVYDALYTTSFPHSAERERSDLIAARLQAQSRGARPDLAPYRLIGLRDADGLAIGAAHISILPVPVPGGGVGLAVPYLQYIYVRASSRRQDMSEVLHALVLGVATADADAAKYQRSVPFTLFETEPAGHGADERSRAFASARAGIHGRSGGEALMLVRRGREGGGVVVVVVSPHVQPGLEVGEPVVRLLWVVRPSPLEGSSGRYNVDVLGRGLLGAYYQSLRDEGFPEENIREAERVVDGLCEGCVFRLMPLEEARGVVG